MQKLFKGSSLMLMTAAALIGGLAAWGLASGAGTSRPAAPTPTAVAATSAQTYLALGDSVAYGIGASSPQQLGYAGVFYQQYLKPALPRYTGYRNLAQPGETTDSFIRRAKGPGQLEQALAEIEQARQSGRPVGLVSLTIGGNDVIAARNRSQAEKEATLQHFDANLQTILKQLSSGLQAGNTERPTLIVSTYYNPFPDSTADELAWVRQFNDLIRQRAAEYQARLADFYPPFVGQETALTRIAQGDIHPNPAGHARLASQVWQALGNPAPAPSQSPPSSGRGNKSYE